MKKILLFCLMLIMMMCLAMPAYAAGGASYITSKTTVFRGDEFTVTIFVSGFPSNKSGKVENISYDSNQFQLISDKCEWLGAVSDAFIKAPYDGRTAVFSFTSPQKIYGNLFKMRFKVKDAATLNKTSNISVTLTIDGQTVKFDNTSTVTVACNHKYGEWKSVGQSGHSRSCSICGKKDSGSHVFDHDCDTECNACGETRETSHVFEEVWVNDETGHWHECVNCKEKTELEAHVPGPEAGEYTDQVCTVCNFVIVPALGHQHRYDTTYQQDEHVHWQLCLGCGEATAQEAHVYDSTCDDLCNVCNYQRPVRHNVGEDWNYDENGHWKECEDCHSKLEDGNHIWNGGTVTVQPQLNKDGKIVYTCGVCQQERTGTVPALTFFEVVPWWGWLAIGFGAGTILVVAVGWIVIAAKSKSKNKGRFSN